MKQNVTYFLFDGTQAVNGAQPGEVRRAFGWTPDMELYFIEEDGVVKHHCIGTEQECREMIQRIGCDSSALFGHVRLLQARGGPRQEV